MASGSTRGSSCCSTCSASRGSSASRSDWGASSRRYTRRSMLKLVIPKGSLESQTLRLFEEADLRVRRGSDRDYHGTIDDDRIERVSILRPQEIPLYVQDGLFDLGITGQDWIAETGADLEVLTTLTYAKTGTGHGTTVVLAV